MKWSIVLFGLLCQCHYGISTTCTSDSDCFSTTSYLLRCDQSSATCTSACMNDTECPVNAECFTDTCMCVDGYTLLNGECNEVIGRTCVVASDCGVSMATCSSDGECECNSDTWNNNGVCESVYNRSCTDTSECGQSWNSLECTNGMCECPEGTYWESTYCRSYLHSSCTADTDCPFDAMYCDGSSYSYNGYCRCVTGANQDGNLCEMVLHASCSDVNCYLSTGGTFCNHENVCKCKKGYQEDIQHICVPAYGSYCNATMPCGSDNMFDCDGSVCNCAENYQLNSEVLNPTYIVETLACIPDIGQPCTELETCQIDHASCVSPDNTTTDGICTCDDDYNEHNGECVLALGQSCFWDDQCNADPSVRCGTSNTCECKLGYVEIGGTCIKALELDCNDDDSYCTDVSGICGLDGTCTCPENKPEKDGVCLRQECQEEVPKLNEKDRRMLSSSSGMTSTSGGMTSSSGGFIISDYNLIPGWYSIQNRHLASVVAGEQPPQIGQCGTYFPIYLDAGLTGEQTDELNFGNTINAKARIGGIDRFDLFEEIDIKIRKCGDDTQVYLKPPSIPNSGYCLDSSSHRVPNTGSYSISIVPSLGFDEVNGENVPYSIFEFQISNNYYWYGYYSDSPTDDGYYYLVEWYVDGKEICRYGPSRDKSTLRLTEKTLVASGFRMGQKLRCSVWILESMFGQGSGPFFSSSFQTGVPEVHSIPWNFGSESFFHQDYVHTPLGCTSKVNDTALTCILKFDVLEVDGVSLCSQAKGLEDPPHHMCGRGLRGVTKLGWEEMQSRWDMWALSYSNNQNGSTTYDYFGTHIQTNADEISSSNNHLRVKFKPADETTGHAIWNNYRIPDMNFYVNPVAQYQSCYIYTYGQTVEIGGYTDMLTPTGGVQSFVSVGVGEYILYRSNELPIEIQIQTEQRDTGIHLCALTYLNGNAIYTTNKCGDKNIDGFLNGDGQESSGETAGSTNIYTRYINGMNIYAWLSESSAHVDISQHSTTGEQIADGEGLCSIMNGEYRTRNGFATSSQDTFADSWVIRWTNNNADATSTHNLSHFQRNLLYGRVSDGESLNNPLRHNMSYAWTEEFYMCHCPNSTEEIPEMVVTSESTSYQDRNIHTGVLRCTLENLCNEEHTGTATWGPLPLPDYSIPYVNITVVPYYSGSFPKVNITCDFKVTTGYFYKVEWKLNDESIHISDYLDNEHARNYELNTYMLGNINLLDIQLECGVSVYDYSSGLYNEVVPWQYSEYFMPYEFVSNEINIMRGGTAIIQLITRLPFACPLGVDCWLEFTVFDVNDPRDCSDCRLVVKTNSQGTCGGRIKGAKTAEEFVLGNTLIEFTVKIINNRKYRLRDTITLNFKVDATIDRYWNFTGNLYKSVTVFVRDDAYWQRKRCYATNDPQMVTFDGVCYMLGTNENSLTRMYYNIRNHAEVQMMTTLCNGRRGVCSCGAIIRAGRDVFIINHCDSHHFTGYILSDDNTLIVRERSQYKYSVTFPHGTTVEIYINYWRDYLVNIYIYPSPDDVNNVEGLCGNFNGDPSDDFTYRDGTNDGLYSSIWWYYYTQTDDFAWSWSIDYNSTESLLQPSSFLYDILEGWNDDEYICFCGGNHGTSDAICVKNEDDACFENDNNNANLGTILARTTRVQRSVSRNRDIDRKIEKIRLARMATRHVVKRDAVDQLTLEEATKICEEIMGGCLVLNDSAPAANKDNLTLACAVDTMLNPDLDWGSETCTSYKLVVKNEIDKDVEYQNSMEIAEHAVSPTAVVNTCECQSGYGSDDCGLDLSLTFDITDVQGEGVCDTGKYGDCSCIQVTVNHGFQKQPYCKISMRNSIAGSQTFTSPEESVGTVRYISFNEIDCCESESSRKKRSTTPSVAQILGISVSNNGVNYGASSTVFVLDTTCQNITTDSSGDYVAILLSGYCFIDGTCYETGNKSTGSDCDVCMPNNDAYGWTVDTTVAGCAATTTTTTTTNNIDSSDDAAMETYMIVLICIGSLLVIGVAVVLLLYAIKKPKAVHPGVGLRRVDVFPANNKFRTPVKPSASYWD